MEFGTTIKSLAIATAACAATAVLLYWGNGLMPRWPLMWLAPLPVLVFALRRPAWQAALVAAAAWMAGGLNLWSYLHTMQMPWFAYFGTTAAVFAASVLAMRTLEARGAWLSAWVALPSIWVAFEFVRNLWLWPHGSAGSIAYSQLNFLPFLQLASITGPWGMGFVLLLFPSGLALAIHHWKSARRQALGVLGATLGVVAAVLIFGTLRLAVPQPGPQATVGLVVSDAGGGASTFAHYAAATENLVTQGARVVVMPEDIGDALDANVAQIDAIFQLIADRTGATLITGVARTRAKYRYDQARIYTPHAAVRRYNKQHLLPPYETTHFTPGRARTLWTAAAGQRWGVAICKDMDFTEPARAYGRADVGLMLVPAGDFHTDRFWHGHIAVIRAVEDGFSVVRSAHNGYLTVADDRGRILAEARSDSAPFAMLLARVPDGHSPTVFLLLGDWFGWVALALTAWTLGRLIGMSVGPVRHPSRHALGAPVAEHAEIRGRR